MRSSWWHRSGALIFGWVLLATSVIAACRDGKGGGKGEAASTSAPKAAPELRPLPDLERLSKEFELSVPILRAAFEVARRTRPLQETLSSSLRPETPERVALGRQLFFDGRLSKSGHIPCHSCHVLEKYGVDGLETAVGHDGQVGKRNTPTVFNIGGSSLFFWDGRAPSLEQQARGPILNPAEMALKDEAEAVRNIAGVPGYAEAFGRAFPDQAEPITFDNIVRAIAAFERQLVTPAPWDRYLAGDEAAVSTDAKRGFALLYQHGCGACHSGVTFGGHGLERVGVREPWPNQEDQGAFEVHGRPMDRMRFKVPSLRNVAKTAPYFHDGSAQTLEQAVRKMAKHQVGKELDDRDVKSLVAFLESLTGELPADLIAPPTLPE